MYNFIELCSGAGGLSTGLIKSGFTAVLLNDNDKNCCETLKKNHQDIEIKCCSLEDINYEKYENQIDLLVAGIPCQSFSHAGKREGLEDPRGQLIYKFVDILNTIKPKIFMIENVKGIMTHNSGKTINEIINILNNHNNYNITYKLLNSFDYNVPQKRERVFIVGTLKTYNINFKFPEKSSTIKLLKDILFDVPESKGTKYSDNKKEYFKYIPQGGCWTSLPEDLQKKYLGKSYESTGGKRGILYRLSLEKPSLTLLCSPTQKQTERCHPLEDRPLTIREYARIQMFDDSYEFCGSISSQYKQIGNAVPVELARRIGLMLIESLNNIK
jgi:DNA (cytosine-5)-methyltransferase 1